MTNILTVDVLKDSIKNGVPGVRDAISKAAQENGKDPKVLERDDQVQRARYAVNYLRKELSGLNVTEKRRVIEASREVIQGALDGVSGELQAERSGARAKDKLDALEAKKKTFTEARAEVVNLEVELADLKDQVGIEVREVSQDVRTAFQDKDWKTIAMYALSAAGAAAAAKWIWDHSIGWLWGKTAGTQGKPGFLRKAAAFTVTVGGAIAGAVGISMFRRNPSNFDPTNLLPEFGKGALAGAGGKAAERGGKQIEALANLPAAIMSLLEGDLDAAASSGWMFIKSEIGWIIDNGLEAFGIPATLYSKINAHMSAQEMGTLYGSTGVTYVLGRATIKGILTGKIRVPLTLRSVGMTALRIGTFPAMVLRDGLQILMLGLSEDGRVVARTTLQRWFVLGAIQDARYARMAKTGDIRSIQKALSYWQGMNRDIGALERQLEGIFKGSVSAESLQAMKNANARLANSLIKGAARFVEKSGKFAKAIPPWLMELKLAGDLSVPEIVREEVDKAAKTLLSGSSEASDLVVDDFSRVLSGESDSVDDLLKELAHLDDAERVALTKNLLSLGDEAPTLKHLLSLDCVGADDLLRAGQRVEDIVSAANGLDDARRLACWGELLRADVSPDILRRCGVAGGELPHVVTPHNAAGAGVAATPKQGTSLRKAVGDGVVVEPNPDPAKTFAPKAGAPDLKVVRPDGTTVDLSGNVLAEGDAAASTVKSMEGAAGAAIALDTKGNARFTELLKQKPIADALNASGKDAKAVESLIATHFSSLDADTLIQLNRSTKAQELIAGALKTADEAEIARMMKSCTKAGRLWRMAGAGGGALGLGGDAFSIYIAIADFQEYGNKIEATNNPALAEFYGQCKLLCIAEGTASAVGLFYQGAAIYGSAKAGGGLITALGTPAGLIALPITVAAVGVGLARKGLQESVEYHSVGEKELMAYPAGKILRHVSQTTSLENLNWTQDLFLFDVAGTGNRGARAEAYSAYFRQIAGDAVAPYTFDDLSEEVRQDITALPEAERATSLHAELEKQHKNALGAFMNDTYQYIRLTTPSMDLTDPQTLKRAETFARVQNLRRRTGQEPLELRLDTIDAVVGPAIKLETDAAAEALVLLQNRPEQANTVLFTALRHELAFCEQRILSADYSNLRKLSADITMQNAARGLIAEQLLDAAREIAGQLHTKGILFSAADYGHAYDRMKNILNQDPNTVARECLAKPNLPHYQKMGGVPNRLSVLGMNDLLSRYRLTKTDILGETSKTALPIENLQFYYADNIKSRKPILMRLPEGATTGFLAATESLWTRSKLTGECINVSGAVALEPGVHQFWYERTMPHVNDNQPVIASSMPAYSAQMSTPRIRILSTPNSRPDFEIIVKESGQRLAA